MCGWGNKRRNLQLTRSTPLRLSHSLHPSLPLLSLSPSPPLSLTPSLSPSLPLRLSHSLHPSLSLHSLSPAPHLSHSLLPSIHPFISPRLNFHFVLLSSLLSYSLLTPPLLFSPLFSSPLL